MNLAEKKKYFNKCDPAKWMRHEDPEYVDFDAFGENDDRVRGYDWSRRLANKIILADGEPFMLFFTGLPGSGKTTELRKLADRLARKDEANLLPVYIDAEEFIDLTNPIDIPDIIATVVYSAERAVLELTNEDPDTAFVDGYASRLWSYLNDTNVEVKGVSKNLVLEMKTRPNFRHRVREDIQSRLSAFIKDADTAITRLTDKARQHGKSGLVVIFDSMERLRGMSQNWEEVINSAERVFTGGAPYLKLSTNIIYTVPPALMARKTLSLEFLPDLKLKTKDGRPSQPGRDAARMIIEKRLPASILQELYGDKCSERLEHIIDWSGGYPRDLLRMVQEAFLSDAYPLSDNEFLRTRNAVWQQVQATIRVEEYPWLGEVSCRKNLILETDDQADTAERLLLNNAILRYQNSDYWYDLHPAVKDLKGVQLEIIKCKKRLEEEHSAIQSAEKDAP